ncbi:MAG: T9SS type A sorting domain-containing protein [Flavobacteriales bacterium]|nr:T9SS type A sorting domain-containing protein [Flavobacteriales bacterium]
MGSRARVLLLALIGGVGTAVAQPSSVDIDLRSNTSGDSLLVYVRPNGQGFAHVVSGLTFTIRWEAASSATLGTRTQFCPEAFSINASGDGEIDNGGFTYRTYNAFGSALIQDECPDRVWVQNAWNLVMRIRVNNIDQCTNFNIVNDGYTGPNNKNYFVSLGGDAATGVIEGTPAQLGACNTDCLGVVGGSALPGTSCNDNDPCTTNDTWNNSCQCVGTAIPGPTITASGSNSPICAGSTLNLSASATGTGTITYTWTGPGFSSSTQNPSITNATVGASGTYTVVASNGCGTASANVPVTVAAAPSAGTLSGGQGICVGGSTTFSSTASGGSWGSSNTNVATINSATGVISGVAAGTATMTYTVTGTGGCSNATATRTVTVTATTNNTASASACDSYTWNVNGQTYTQSGSYTSVNGCHTETLNLTIVTSTNNVTTASACDSYTWNINGQTYTQSGTYTSVSGCGTQTLELTITPSTSNTTSASACGSYTWSVHGQTQVYTQGGTYTSVNGCHTETLELTITPITGNTTTASACDSYTWNVNGQTYTQSGLYTSVNGCHADTLELTITPATSNTTSASACDSYTWNVNGQTYTQGGTYTSVSGCHTETLVLTINESSENTTEVDVCGASYTWAMNGQTYTASGSYSFQNGCVNEVLVLTLTVPGTPCDDGNPNTHNDRWSQNCTCVGETAGCDQFVNLIIATDANGGETTWEIVPEGGGTPLCSGGPYTGVNNSVLGEQCCLADGCYALRVYDSAGDGMTTGGYVLKEGGASGRRIIDNTGDGVFESVSAIAGGQGFCLPLGNDHLIYPHCDKLFWTANEYVVAIENTAVSATWVVGGANSVQPANSGYEFWIFDPDGTYSYRRFRNHSVSDGFSPANALRACHMKINSWVNTVTTPHIPEGVLMNVRVRGRVLGVNQPFGPACRFKMDAALALCPPTTLVNTPQMAEYSCGVVKPFGGTANIYAWSRPGANRYQFEFTVPGEGNFHKVATSNNNVLRLNWTADRLVNGATYNVRVRVSKDQGVTWCPWGDVCYVTISQPGTSGMIAEPVANGTAVHSEEIAVLAWPNPNAEGRLSISVRNLPAATEQVGIELYDLTGKKVAQRMITAEAGVAMGALELDVRSGMYLMRVSAGAYTTTERIIVSH